MAMITGTSTAPVMIPTGPAQTAISTTSWLGLLLLFLLLLKSLGLNAEQLFKSKENFDRM